MAGTKKTVSVVFVIVILVITCHTVDYVPSIVVFIYQRKAESKRMKF
jgi:hypothetical protein